MREAPRARSLIDADRAHLIHSAVSWRDHERGDVRILESGDGVFLTDNEGHRLLDGFSGLWCVNLGYGQRKIVDAAAAQMSKLPYATGYFSFGNEPAILLAQALSQRAPGDLNHVFFTLGGSDAVDSAIRFIRYYFNATGRPEKQHMIALDRGYHGSSGIGAGLTGLAAFHANFGAPLRTQHHIRAPYRYRDELPNDTALIKASVSELHAKIDELGEARVAAFFAEPMIGSGGVIVPPDGWLRAIREACLTRDVLFVADEVITGFGRTGPMFGCEYDGVAPDLMTLAKGLTSGYAPMGAVLLSDQVYRGITDNAPAGIIGHGLTYSGHPVSAAVALAVLEIYDEENILDHVAHIAPQFERQLQDLSQHPLVGEVRVRGMLGALELVADKRSKARFDSAVGLSTLLTQSGYRHGLLFRAFADGIVGLAPPLVCSEEEIDMLVVRLAAVLDDVAGDRMVRQAMNWARGPAPC